MIKKGSKLFSVLFNKCPRCHEGDFLVEKNPLKIHKATTIHTKCGHCGLKYMMEPSFFYGAMYVNYALTVALAVITFFICVMGFDLSLTSSFMPIVSVLIVTAPFTIRLSRIIWINFFVKYNPTNKS